MKNVTSSRQWKSVKKHFKIITLNSSVDLWTILIQILQKLGSKLVNDNTDNFQIFLFHNHSCTFKRFLLLRSLVISRSIESGIYPAAGHLLETIRLTLCVWKLLNYKQDTSEREYFHNCQKRDFLENVFQVYVLFFPASET